MAVLYDLPNDLQNDNFDGFRIAGLYDLPNDLQSDTCDGFLMSVLYDLPNDLQSDTCDGFLMSALYDLPNDLQSDTCDGFRMTGLYDLQLITCDGSPEAARLAIMASPSQDLQSVLKGREDFHMASAIHNNTPSGGQNQSFYF